MAHWLCAARRGQETGWRTRFDPSDWTVDFPRPAMAAVTTTLTEGGADGSDGLRVDAVYCHKDELAGLIWEAADRFDHPLLRRETARDFRGCRLSFRWRSGGLKPLDAVHGPVLTIEGRDEAGAPRTWYVRLWNYAQGSPTDAVVAIDFASVAGGFLLPGEADPVWAGDVDRMFVSLPPAGYDPAGGGFASAQACWAELSELACDGPGAVLEVGDAVLLEHALRIANGYDDCYHLTPERVLRNAHALGYRGTILHYVGMSHFMRLERSPGDGSGGWYVSLAGGVLNAACAAWHRDFAERAQALGYGVIWSLSYELFDAYCWGDWKQRAADGSPALTGWSPPSTLLSPAHAGAMGYLRQVAGAFVGIALAAGLAVRFQIGEPWWWVMPDGRPCLYDDSAKGAFGGSPMAIANIAGPLNDAQEALLDQAGAVLAASTLALSDAVKAAALEGGAPGAEVLLLAYLPTVLTGEARRANLPVGWAWPAFDVLQLEDYDWCAAGDVASSARGVAAAQARLGYPVGKQHYLAGFAQNPGEWDAIAAGAARGAARGVAETFVWALPQVLRDGFTYWDGEDEMQAFDDVLFPLALGREAEVSPGFQTAVTTSAGGHEARNAGWAAARTRYDVGPGVRSEADIRELLAFYRARLGPARAFRFSDPFDAVSGSAMGPGPLDEAIGTGDGSATRFALVKHYGAATRRIGRPVAGSVRVAVGGMETAGFSVTAGGWVELDTPPAVGAAVTAGFRFEVAVRFAEDQLRVNRATFLAGEAASVPLVEVREA